ncbi:protein of unknown function DUF214 [Coriobacterium glomerans PW2]|uniref:ABC3 transporter permease C-terminal domain-containing protein n=1 Tax=Coriobacterium glomerans (strain ATCC 49209 / DSM 20642 / JCM 10262 / PW2) TaxID=700015 RepID=F2NAZ9_CORGP|nr:ABC transporter permease [Coriobacterium glomerans]AEB07677.1 protein of unknown function DUF214 [Coriobacterium glomerans PW2]
MLCRLAWGNVRRAGRDYLVYLLTLAFGVTVFYAFNTISIQIDYAGLGDDSISTSLGGMIFGLTIFLAFVLGFLMVYANNFIMKRRKKQFGLYQILGMRRTQVARIMTMETLFVSIAALVLGVAMGVGLSQLMVFFTASLFKAQISSFHFFFSMEALLITVECLAAIFLVTLVFNLRVVARAKVIDLISAGRHSETVRTRSPRISAVIFLIGAVLIGVAYARLIHDGMPLDGYPESLMKFLITTIMVILGTILLFFGLSGFLIEVLQRARVIYWRGLNMFTLRQLAAKVNTVSFSMAVISMILFLAITSVSCGMSIASAMTSMLEESTPADFTIGLMYTYPMRLSAQLNPRDGQAAQDTDEVAAALRREPIDMLDQAHKQAGSNWRAGRGSSSAAARELDSILGRHVQVNLYSPKPVGSDKSVLSLGTIVRSLGENMPAGMKGSDADLVGLTMVSASDWNRYREFRGMEPVDLGDDGYTLLAIAGDTVTGVYNRALGSGMEIDIAGHSLHPRQKQLERTASSFGNGETGGGGGTVVVPDAVIRDADLPLATSYLLLDYKSGVSVEQGDRIAGKVMPNGPIENSDDINIAQWFGADSRTDVNLTANSTRGIISYLSIYIGFVLVVACASILTIQQLSSVADSSRSVRILSELGTARREIMHSVLGQQIVYFAFPLIVAGAHSLVALSVVIQLVKLLGGLTIADTVGVVVAIFVLAYGGYFLVTYAMSKSIVRDAIRVRHTE